MTLPTRTNWATENVQSAADSAATVTTGSIPDGSWMLLAIVAATTTFTATNVSGWTELIPRTSMGTRSFWLYGKIASSEPTTYTGTLSGITAARYTIMWGTGADPTIANWQIGTVKLRNTIAADDVSNIAPSITTTGDDTLVLAFSPEATNATETNVTSVTGATAWFFAEPQAVSSQLIESLSVSYIDKATAGATGDVTVVYPNVQNANGLGVQIGLTPAPIRPPGVQKIYLGDPEIASAYCGDTLIYEQ